MIYKHKTNPKSSLSTDDRNAINKDDDADHDENNDNHNDNHNNNDNNNDNGNNDKKTKI